MQLGLVELVVPRDQLGAEADQVILKKVESSPATVRSVRSGIHAVRDMEYERALEHLSSMPATDGTAEDMPEAIASIVEKGGPVWKGE